MKPLSELQQRVYDVLDTPADTDVAIYKLYEAAYQTNVHVVQNGVLLLGVRTRVMQQRLGSVIARINEKLADEKAKAAKPKGRPANVDDGTASCLGWNYHKMNNM